MIELRDGLAGLPEESRQLFLLLSEQWNLRETPPAQYGPVGASKLLVPLQPLGDRPALFCIHRDDGLVFCYEELARRLGLDQPVYGIQSLGIDEQETPLTSVQEMAARYLREVRACCPAGPYLFLGSSFGGVIAYEMGQQLRQQGGAAALVGFLDTFAPTALREHYRDRPVSERAPIHLDVLRRLDTKSKLQYIATKAARRVRKSLGTHQTYEDDGGYLPETIVSVQTANSRAYQSYHPEPYAGRTVMFRALEWNVFDHHDPELWWGGLADGGMEIRDVPGDHLSMLRPPHVDALAASVRAVLDDLLA